MEFKLARILTYLDEQVNDDIVFLKTALDKTNTLWIDGSDYDLLCKEFLQMHPEYKKYLLVEAGVPISWQSKLCYTVFVRLEINDSRYVLEEAMSASQTELSAGQKLKTARKLKGLSQAQLSEKAEVAMRSIQQYENNSRSLNGAAASTVKRIAQVLEVNMEDLID